MYTDFPSKLGFLTLQVVLGAPRTEEERSTLIRALSKARDPIIKLEAENKELRRRLDP